MIPQIDFEQFAIEVLPEDKRKYPFWSAWFKGLFSQTKRLATIFGFLFNGRNATKFDPTTQYQKDDLVVFDYRPYISIGSTLNETPPLHPEKWQSYSKSFIGTKERAKFTTSKLTLEWALNRHFRNELIESSFSGFKQPPLLSDIYITNTSPSFTSFIVGINESQSSSVYSTSSGVNAILNPVTFAGATSYQFAINIPLNTYDEINSDHSIAEKIVRNFVDKYIASGVHYTIQTY